MQVLTVDEFIERIGATEADNVAGEGLRTSRRLNTVKIEGALNAAGDLISGYIRGRYPQPIEPVPDLLRDIATEIALYKLRLKTGDQSGVTPELRARYDDALRQLRDIQAGRLAIDANQPGADNAPAIEKPVLVTGRPSRAREILDAYDLSVTGGRR